MFPNPIALPMEARMNEPGEDHVCRVEVLLPAGILLHNSAAAQYSAAAQCDAAQYSAASPMWSQSKGSVVRSPTVKVGG